MRALLIEPDTGIADAIGRQLDGGKIKHDRIGADDVHDLLENEDAALGEYDAVIIGGLDRAAETVAMLRNRHVDAAILCLLDRRCSQTTVSILRAGADDVVVKPVVSAEIRARIEATRRRSHGLTTNAVHVGRLVVYLDGRDPEVDGERLHLSQREHAILSVLALNHRRVVSKERIYEAVYGLSGSDPLDKVIDVYICKLRKKIAGATSGGKYIETVYGRGYKFEAPPEDAAHAEQAIGLARAASRLPAAALPRAAAHQPMLAAQRMAVMHAADR